MPKLDILPLRGAFPQIHPFSGNVCVEQVGFWQTRWTAADPFDQRQIWQTGNDVQVGHPPTGVVVYPRGVPRLGAGGGNFAVSMQPGPGVHDGIWLNGTQHLDPVGGVLGADAYNFVSEQGDVLWLSPFQSDDKSVWLYPAAGWFSSVNVHIAGPDRHLECARMVGDLITWRRGSDSAIFAALFDRFDRVLTWTHQQPDLGEPTGAPIPILVGDQPWVLRQYFDRGGYCLHPEGDHVGYRVDGVDTFNPDAVCFDGQHLLVASQQQVGIAVELRTFDVVAEPRIDLRKTPPNPQPAPPRIAIHATSTRVAVGELVTFTVELLPNSGPVHAHVEWFEDAIGDGEHTYLRAVTTAFTTALAWDRPGHFLMTASVNGPGGRHTSDPVDMTVEPVEEPEMQLPNEHDYQNFFVQLQAQGYQKYLKRERGLFTTGGPVSDPHTGVGIDDVAIGQWLCATFTRYFVNAPANAKPTRLDYAMRWTIRDIKNHPDAPADSPDLPPEWDESFNENPLLPSSR